MDVLDSLVESAIRSNWRESDVSVHSHDDHSVATEAAEAIIEAEQRAEQAEAELEKAKDIHERDCADYAALCKEMERLRGELADRDETLRVMRQEMGLLDREGK